MITLQITEQTPHDMLRAIRAACNELLGEARADLTTQAAQHNSRAEELRVASERELDKSASCLSRYGQGGPLNVGKLYPVGEQEAQQMAEEFREAHPEVAAAFQAVPGVDIPGPTDMRAPADVDPSVDRDSTGAEWNPELHASTKSKNSDGTWKKRRGAAVPDAPPVPPAPAAPAEPIMPKIFALITSQIVTINQAVEAAQAEGFADLGANGLGGAPREAQEAVLRKLEG